MGMFSAINTAASGLSAERLKLDVISENLANANSTRTADGSGAYRRKRVILAPRTEQPYFRGPFLPEALQNQGEGGVRVTSIEKDMDAELRKVYDPTHPDAVQTGENKGYVFYPNVNTVDEMVDMISASRAYEANLAVMEGSSRMFDKALAIGRS